MRHLYAVGLVFKSEQFDPNKPYTGCRICGAVYQTGADRTAITVEAQCEALLRRRAWSHKHAKSHSSVLHKQLQDSGHWCTPAAAQVLSSFGIIALSDMVMSDEHEDALKNAKAKEVECSTK